MTFDWKIITKNNIKRVCKDTTSNRLKYIEAGLELGYKIEAINEFLAVKFSYKNKVAYLINGAWSFNGLSACRVASNKYLTNTIWKEYSIYCPNFWLARKMSDIKKNPSFPLVAKPARDTIRAEMVITDIRTKKELRSSLEKIIKKHDYALVEDFHKDLNEYRILIFRNQILAVSQKKPPYVLGNGKSKIIDLINILNRNRKKYEKHNIRPVIIDANMKRKLKRQNLSLRSVLVKGQEVALRDIGNLASGGETYAITNIHPSVRKMALKAAQVLDLRYCGLDLLAKDISKPLKKSRDVFIEANEIPGINLHFDWDKKEMPPIAEKIMKQLFK